MLETMKFGFAHRGEGWSAEQAKRAGKEEAEDMRIADADCGA